MPELLKNMYNRESLYEVAVAIQSVYNSFKVDEFIKSTMDETWNNLELKARCRKISMSLGMYLPEDYKEALSILEKSVTGFYFAFFFPDFVEVYGQDDINWDLSISALERNTEYWSSEFAVRAFIIKDEERMMAQMRKWSKHKSEHVRRLASEGCRPQLPWGQAISKFKKDPTPVLPILEQLKTDTSTYVQKSVANNLNDISKTHPDLVISIAKDWYGKNKSTNWIVKHGCRTLLKKGNRDVLALFGYDDTTSINLQDFTLETTSISIGEDLTFSFKILAKKATKTRLEYGIDYMKSNGKRNRKIFKISEVSLKENEKKSYMKKHSFADVSVRRHYPGIHSITIIINGVEKGKLDFELGV
ncbi:DNA alkylation repair protein [Clostridioides difficile]|uniref:DNA alkylation repair protein n=1 Tax=Clostridioides difficile TaxID=1496 RepID=UPI000D1EEF93|nr:DNA alkylation repair protein [Clostridioides difficile]MBJ9783780.1 DNA alkylation repair protein [Clostridioides difficile]MCI0948357.1 DNA alkylation repair protein [Clostridioides difficile]HBG2118026.1 DNA alkylation repair protein [Clostridioides difficile]HBG2167677.1 DNA alkylation repair protein [Clostridioides difficile]HBH3805298.1 DNA alkylation repair protein [Clostridioides difficile]